MAEGEISSVFFNEDIGIFQEYNINDKTLNSDQPIGGSLSGRPNFLNGFFKKEN